MKAIIRGEKRRDLSLPSARIDDCLFLQAKANYGSGGQGDSKFHTALVSTPPAVQSSRVAEAASRVCFEKQQAESVTHVKHFL